MSKSNKKAVKLSAIFDNFNFEEAGYIRGFEGMSTQQQDAFASIVDYMYNPHLLPRLSTFDHVLNNDGSNRLRRSERRQAHALVLAAVFLRYDFESEKIGVPWDDGSFHYAPMIKLARISGLTIKKNDNPEDQEDEHIKGVPLRFARAWRDLIESGIICQTEQFREQLVSAKNGTSGSTIEMRGVTSIKRMNSSVFIELGGISKEQIGQLKAWAKASRLKRYSLSKAKVRKAAAKQARSAKQRKPRMSARIRAILDNLFSHYLKYYRQLKRVYPANSKEWYREQIALAFPH